MIPNIIHMMWFTGPKSRDFGFLNYLAVKIAAEVQKPDHYYFYYNAEPANNPHWEAIKPYVTMVQIDPPTEIGGVSLDYPQYQSDVVRLQKLLDHGGIYLDTDILLLKPLTPLMNNSCVMGADRYTNDRVGLHTTDPDQIASVANGVILAERGNPFIGQWLDAIPAAIKSDVWANHAVVLPFQMYCQDPSVFALQKVEAFIPFGFMDKFIFGNNDGDFARLDRAYSVHMWETIWTDDVKKIDNNYLRTEVNLFTRLFGKYAGEQAMRDKKLKVCVYAISKNEEMFVERFAASAKEADYVLIADTGSTDNTVATAQAAGCIVHSICISPWRFDLARNAALVLIPSDVDVCISLDLDEILEPGWREDLERVWKEDTTRLRYYFDWGCGIKFKYEKIHHRKGYMWHHPCHEYPIPDPRTNEVWADTDMLMVSHHPDPTKSRGQYLDLLAVSVKEDPRCPRNAFYYARELTFYGKLDEALEALNKYLTMPEATWMNERCYAYRLLGQTYENKGDQWSAESAYHKACAEAPNTREPWVDLAMLKFRQCQWPETYAAAMRALGVVNRELVYTCDPTVWGAKPHDLAAIAAWHMFMQDEAIKHATIAANLEPEDERLQANLRFILETPKEKAE